MIRAVIVGLVLILATSHVLARTSPPPVVLPPPLLPDENIGDWTVHHLSDASYAYTTNSSKSTFGVYCSDTCIAYVDFSKGCDDGEDYPAMINSAWGAYNITLRCAKAESGAILGFELTESVLSTMETGGQIGFAIPLNGGEFNVARFSLTGSLPAVRRVKGPGETPAIAPKDTKL